MSQKLAQDYKLVKAAGRDVEVVWLSCERDVASFWATLRGYPWPAVPFDSPLREQALSKFQVRGIPRLVILGPDGRVVDNDAAGSGLALASVDAWLRQAGAR
mmetsp:Transcript_21572/g.66263  ORF Transcript_21572/g.66263 Transcript_21572/m.66263 type:complete len:102 (-) Transcript_21572:112-417(-)